MEFESLKKKYHYYRDLTDYKLLPNSYVIVMLDGRSFSKKIKNNFKRPFDEKFIEIMNETAKYVCENVSNCKLAYVQSDEINLILYDTPMQGSFFNNRLCKIQSIIASMATSKFNQLALLNTLKELPCSKEDAVQIINDTSLYEFDCKAWVVPNENDAFAAILYRQNDCIRNSKEAVAQYFFSHNELHKKTTDEQIAMVKSVHCIDWNLDYNDGEKYGRFIVKNKLEFTEVNIENISTVKTYIRHKWEASNAFPLCYDDNRNKFINYIVNGGTDG